MASEETEPLLEHEESIEVDSVTSTNTKTRVTALLLLFLLSTGANWTEACLGPLKSTLVRELAINNAQYGVISASTQLANTILPIFAGLCIDRYGASRMAIFATSTICIGALIAAIACTSANYAMLVASRIVQGIGVIIVDTAATKLIVTWSRAAGWLGLAISCNFAFDRAAGALSKASAVPLAQWGDVIRSSNTFWVAALISTASLLAALIYSRFEQRHSVKSSTRSTPSLSVPVMLRRTMTSLPTFYVYIIITQFYQPIAVFNNLSADILRWRGSSQRASGYLASIGQVTPILIAPLLGGFFDRYGHRMEFIPLTALLLGSSIGLLAWSNVSSLFAMIIFSLGNAVNTPPYLCSLAILLKDEATFGSSFGLWKSAMQNNQVIMNVTLGKLQDSTPGNGYERVLLVLFVTKVIEFVWGLSYVALDHLWACGILTADDSKRQFIESCQSNSERRQELWRSCGLRPNWYSTFFAALYFGVIIIAAWTLFFVYYHKT